MKKFIKFFKHFFSGLLDTITSTADAKDCPGMCVHTLATLICYDVLDNVACPSPMMRCCIEPPVGNETNTNKTQHPSSTHKSTLSTTTPIPIENNTQVEYFFKLNIIPDKRIVAWNSKRLKNTSHHGLLEL